MPRSNASSPGNQLAPILVIVLLCASCALLTNAEVARDDQEIWLPHAASASSDPRCDTTLEVRLRSTGELSVSGRGVSLDELGEYILTLPEARVVPVTVVSLGGESPSEVADTCGLAPETMSVKLFADKRAPFGQLQWVLSVLGDLDIRSALLVCDAPGDGSSMRALELIPNGGHWHNMIVQPKFVDSQLVIGVEIPNKTTAAARPNVEVQYRWRGDLFNDEAALAAKLATHYSLDAWPSSATVEADPRVCNQAVVSLLGQLHRAGVRRFEIGVTPPHPWVRRLDRLPTPHCHGARRRWIDEKERPRNVVRVVLPATPHARDLQSEGGRLMQFTVQECGDLWFKDTRIPLGTLQMLARNAMRSHHGQQSISKKLAEPPVFVVLPDRDIRFGSVRKVLTAMVLEGVTVVHVAAYQSANLAYSEQEAGSLGVVRAHAVPQYLVRTLQSISWALVPGKGDGSSASIRLTSESSHPGDTLNSLSLGGWTNPSAAVAAVTASREPNRTWSVVLEVDDGIPLKYVVALAGELSGRGHEVAISVAQEKSDGDFKNSK